MSNTRRLIVVAVMVLAIVSLTVRAADPEVIFWDNISGYTLNTPPAATLYENVNSDVVHSQNNGNLTVASTIGVWSETAPDQLVSIQSGVYAAYDTVAVNRNSTARYGQIMVRIGKTANELVRVGLFGVSNPSFPYQWGNSTDAGIEVLWNVNKMLHYGSSGAWTGGVDGYSITQFHTVTINYDLTAQTYDVWYNTTKVVSSLAFNAAITSAKSIAIGGAYWASGEATALDYWHWQVSDSNPFTSYSGELPKPLNLIATNPSPLDGEMNAAENSILSWTAGDNSTSHDVYFGTNLTSVTNANHSSSEFKGNQPGVTYNPGTLSDNTTYYWRIDEVSPGGTATGTVWSFSVPLFVEPSSEVVFVDNISGYYPTRYDWQNDAVVLTKDNGGRPATGTSWGPYSVIAPKNLVTLDSGAYQKYTTLAVSQSRSERYGQILVRVASTGGKRVRLGAFGTAAPQIPDYVYDYDPYSGPEVMWDLGDKFAYFTQTAASSPYAEIIGGVGSYSDHGYHNITINYDLELDKYSVFLDNYRIITDVNFAYPQTTIESMAIGASWEGAGDYWVVLDYWHWKVSNVGPFTCFGREVAKCGGPGEMRELGDINADCYVDFKDVRLLALYWLNSSCTAGTECADADLKIDTVINNGDFAMLAESWMNCTDADNPNCVAAVAPTIMTGWYAMSEYTGSPAVPAYSRTPLDESPSHNFDYIMLYQAFSATGAPEGLLAYMDYAQTHGIKVVVDIRAVDVEGYHTQTSYVRNHPALYGYYLADEPDYTGNPNLAELLLRYNAVKGTDPDKPVFTSYLNPVTADYLQATDVALRETYLNSVVPSVYNDVQVAHNAGKMLMVCPKAFENPSASDFRYQAFGGIAQGADGVMPFIFEGFAPDTGTSPEGFRDTVVYPTMDILYSLEPLLLEGSKPYLTSSTTLSNGVARFVGDSDDALLIAVNHNDSSQNGVQITVNGLNPSITTATVVGESRTISLSGNTFTDNFGARGVHIYRFQKP